MIDYWLVVLSKEKPWLLHRFLKTDFHSILGLVELNLHMTFEFEIGVVAGEQSNYFAKEDTAGSIVDCTHLQTVAVAVAAAAT